METLEQRKAKFKKHMDNAGSYESEDEMLEALKEYKRALKFSLHQKDTLHIEKKIKQLQDKVKYLADFSGEDPRDKNPNVPIYIVGGIMLILVLAAIVYFVLV